MKIALIGQGISHSLTPSLHMSEGEANGIAYQYDLVDISKPQFEKRSIGQLLEFLKSECYHGANITYPFKVQVLGELSVCSEIVDKISSSNTVVLRDGKWIGDNTDAYGFQMMLKEGMGQVRAKSALLLGAGGAGKAVIAGCAQYGLERLWVYDPNPDATNDIQNLSKYFPNLEIIATNDVASAMQSADGVINATPIGMNSEGMSPLNPSLLASHHFVADIVYFPLETELLKQGASKGCRVISGAQMAVYQAAKAFEIFTGIKPNEERMKVNLAQLIAGKGNEI